MYSTDLVVMRNTALLCVTHVSCQGISIELKPEIAQVKSLFLTFLLLISHLHMVSNYYEILESSYLWQYFMR